jgi:hypothetical protein
MTLEIAELKTPEELNESYSVMRELREHIASDARAGYTFRKALK